MTNEDKSSDRQHSRILIVDDDRTARLILKEILHAEGMEVLEAEDGETGLARFHECEPDLVLMDLDMPVMDGLTACAEIRRLRNKASLPIIMISGHQDAQTINSAYEAGVSDFVVKPVNPSLLANRIRANLADSGAPLSTGGGEGSDRLLETLPDQVLVVDRSGKILEQAGSAGKGGEADAAPDNIAGLWAADVCAELQRMIRKALKTRQHVTWKFQVTIGEGQRHHEARVVPQGINRALLIVRDITADATTDAKMETLGLYDALTGLPNRFFFLKRLNDYLTNARFQQRQLALVLLDLEAMERKRETLGRQVVDAMLVAASKRLRHGTRSSDAGSWDEGEVALLDDHRFGVLLRNVADRDSADKVANRLAESLREPIDVKGQDIRLDVRIGIALFPDDGGDIEMLLQVAEQAVVEFGLPAEDEEMVSTGVRRKLASLREDLFEEVRWGFENDQFELHYLPKFDIRRGRIAGVEALLRWQHPLRGQVPLSEFFPVIQDSGLIVPVGDWVLRTACAQLENWRRERRSDLVMAVNCASQQFALDDFVKRVSDAVEETGIEPGVLELDLTEAMLVRNHDVALGKLGRLKEMGVALVLDDFGTGFTSLQHFSQMPLDALKIDRTFVRQLAGPPAATAICGAIVDIAHRFGAIAVAEGVESDAQLETLTRLGCDQMQGFLLTRPLPAEQMSEFLERGEQLAS